MAHAQETAYVEVARPRPRLLHHRPPAGDMSTAEVARDMDVLRRAVGDPALTFLGFTYGTALGQFYANMFPDRVRALAIDGVLDPQSWSGARRPATSGRRAAALADGAYRALQELLERCDQAGEK